MTLVFCAGALAENYRYSSLIIKDYDEMRQMVQSRIKKAKAVAEGAGEDSGKDAEAVEHLRDALKLIFSRPDNDNMVAKLTPDVKRELTGFNAYEDSISSLAAECIELVKRKNATVSQQSTALFVLENMLREIKPEAVSNEDLQNVIKRIADADLKITDEVKRDRKIRSMYATKNPSEEAKSILKAMPKKKAADGK